MAAELIVSANQGDIRLPCLGLCYDCHANKLLRTAGNVMLHKEKKTHFVQEKVDCTTVTETQQR